MSRRVRSVAAGVLLTLALAACSSGAPTAAPPPVTKDAGFGGFALAVPVAKPEATLTDTTGAAFPLVAGTAGTVTMLYVGYTRCPDLCPLVLADLTVALRQLSPPERAKVRVVFVTADPAYDTPARIRTFLDRFDPSFLGLTGSLDQLEPFYTALGIPLPEQVTGSTDEVEHAADVYAFSPAGPAYLAYDTAATPQTYATDIRSLLAGRTPAPVADADLVRTGGVGRVGLVSVYRAFVRRTPDGSGELVLTMSNQGQDDSLTQAQLVAAGTSAGNPTALALPGGGTPTQVGADQLRFGPGTVPDAPAIDIELRFAGAGLMLVRVPVVGV